jgi:hypothetical protein
MIGAAFAVPQPPALDPGALDRAASSAPTALVVGGALALLGAAWLSSRCACATGKGRR